MPKGKKAGGKSADEQDLELMTFGEEDEAEDAEDIEDEAAEESEEGDETELAEGDGDGSDSDGGDGEDGGDEEPEEVNPRSNRHGQMTTKGHAHGRFAEHSHHGDADHSDAPLKADDMAYSGKGGAGAGAGAGGKKASTKASERAGDAVISLAEAKALREELAQYRYRLREADVEKTIERWAHNTYRFRESAKGPIKRGKIAISKAFADAYREFKLRGAGLKLSESDDAKFDELMELGLSVAIVDLERRSPGSRDTEKRRTVRASEHAGGADGEVSEDVRLQERAEELAVEEHEGKQLSELSYAQQMALYDKAAREITR